MLPFNSYIVLKESVKKELTHLEHIEDEIFNSGRAGSDYALDMLYNLGKMVEGHSLNKVNLSIKWDGAPAIVCGIDPTSKRFFVGTKSIFNRANPKINFTPGDVDKNHGDKPGLAKKLKLALRFLPSLNIKNILQGDFLFDSETLKRETIDEKVMFVFTPNTITYAIEENSELGNRIKNAKFGIVFHTEYTGKDLAQLQYRVGYSTKELTPSKNVFFDDALIKDFSGMITFTKDENTKFKNILNQSKKIKLSISKNAWGTFTRPDFTLLLKTFINSQIREGILVGDVDQFINGFFSWFGNRMNKEIEKLSNKSEENPAVKKRLEKIAEIKNIVHNNSEQFKLVLNLYKNINDLKLMVLEKIKNLKTTAAGSFLKTPEGYKVTAPEGLVVSDRIGNAVKLVDRLTFSRANFANTGEFE